MKEKIKLFGIIILCLLAFSCNNKKAKVQKSDLKGKVKLIEEVSYSAKYNINGEIVRSSDRFLQKLILDYDEKGNLKESKNIESDGLMRSYKQYYNFDYDGNIIKVKSQFKDKTVLSCYMIYDCAGNQIERITYMADGTIQRKESYVYDNWGNQIEEYKYNYSTFRYFTLKLINKYDVKGNKVETTTFKYDGERGSRNTSKYDNNGNQTEICYFNSKDSLLYKNKFKYEVDKIGNWIKKIHFINEKPDFIVERNILYY
ncbi:MAG: hypothetical protein HXX09_09660 [Bacteroidetes bacterium]|nr:hypothetical protein [Bacteroidota bacterium]